ncbi:MarR family winged helix-turn-helix transcriptional regulator [Paracoccus sp. T5]|uniref:MarR family winged helix-turn-helix transcriptional regulator n=1 Tax=Paracoccus sp. T5 TaxID=3402161 RepID=UPI003ADD426E
MRDITARVHLDKSMVSRAATRLVQNGIVSISTHGTDRRLVVLELTEEGRTLMRRRGPIAEAFQAKLLDELQDDAVPLQRALLRINAGLSSE